MRVDPEAHAVHLLGGRHIPYDRLLIASGARPRLLGLKGEELSGVYTLRTLADWQRLAAGLPRAGRVVVVGAGAVGLKTADALARRGLTVTLVARGAQPLSRVLDPTGRGPAPCGHNPHGDRDYLPFLARGHLGRGRPGSRPYPQRRPGNPLPGGALLHRGGPQRGVPGRDRPGDRGGHNGGPPDGHRRPRHLRRRRLRPRLTTS